MFFSGFKNLGFSDYDDDSKLKNFLFELKNLTADFEEYDYCDFDNPVKFLLLPFCDFDIPKFDLSVIKHILVVGIGGSSMGAKAVYYALFGYYDNVMPKRYPKIHFIENVDERYILSLINNVLFSFKKEELAVFVICKSGKTFETLKNISIIYNDKFKNLFDGSNTYVISVKNNDTWRWGQSIGAKLFEMHPSISGRFSVFSYVSLLPLSFAGVPINDFLKGAKDCVKNLSVVNDIVRDRFKLYKEKLYEDVYFVFDERLKNLGEWMCSIIGESLGKEGQGITPIVSVGSRDLHSLGQLYLQGKRNKVTFFLSLTDSDDRNLLILKAVEKAYEDANLPYCLFSFNSNTQESFAYELGYFIEYWLIYAVALGELMGIDPYNQPGVEMYKRYLIEQNL